MQCPFSCVQILGLCCVTLGTSQPSLILNVFRRQSALDRSLLEEAFHHGSFIHSCPSFSFVSEKRDLEVRGIRPKNRERDE